MKIINLNLIQKSFIFFLVLSTLLALFLFFPYNQRNEVFAETVCWKRPIPVGLAIELTQYSGNQILGNLDKIINETENQVYEARAMINFANECHRIKGGYNIVRCRTGCREWTTTHPIEWTCRLPESDVDGSTYTSLKNCQTACIIEKENEDDIKGSCVESAWETEYHCEILPCSHDNTKACDFDGIKNSQNQIKNSFNKITTSLLKEIPEIIDFFFRDKRKEWEPPELPEQPIVRDLLIIAYHNLRFCAGQPGMEELLDDLGEKIVCCYILHHPYWTWKSSRACDDIRPDQECIDRIGPKPEPEPPKLPELPTPLDRPIWFVLDYRTAEMADPVVKIEIDEDPKAGGCFPMLKWHCLWTDFFCCVISPPSR